MLLKKRSKFNLKELDEKLRCKNAYKNFFRDKKVGYPRFKSKKSHQHSYTTVCINNNIKGYFSASRQKVSKA